MTSTVIAAGTVVLRKGSPASNQKRPREVLLVHRPKYDDWSFPKGKLDRYEHPTTAAVRETAEETGLDVCLGPPLPSQSYPLGTGAASGGARGRIKVVDYWTARVVGDDDVSGFCVNDEIDQVAWVEVGRAAEILDYDHDRETLAHALAYRKRSTALIVLRHGKARSRRGWRGDDRERPLTRLGEFQSEQIVPILAAYGASRLVSSSSRRCWTTLGPYADVTGYDLEETRHLSEEDAGPAGVGKVIESLLTATEPAVVCTHRPVLPLVWEAIGVPPAALEPASLAVVHHRAGQVITVETHAAPSGR